MGICRLLFQRYCDDGLIDFETVHVSIHLRLFANQTETWNLHISVLRAPCVTKCHLSFTTWSTLIWIYFHPPVTHPLTTVTLVLRPQPPAPPSCFANMMLAWPEIPRSITWDPLHGRTQMREQLDAEERATGSTLHRHRQHFQRHLELWADEENGPVIGHRSQSQLFLLESC